MVDIDKDGDAIMDPQNNAEKNIIDHTNKVGQHIVTAFQNSTDEMFEKLKEIIIGVRNQPHDVRSPVYQYPSDSMRLPLPNPRNENIIHQLNTDNARLKDSLQISEAKLTSLEEEVRDRDKKSRELELALFKSRTELKRLNTIIIKGGTQNTGPSDDQVRAEFCSIRDSILRITRGHYQATSVSLSNPRKESLTLLQRRQKWLANWSRDTPEIRNYRIQGAIFDIVYTLLFSRPVFGVDEDLEKQLRFFETDMVECSEISRGDLVEWRRRTVTAAKYIKSKSKIVADRAAKKIQDTLEPALTQSPRETSHAKASQLDRDVLALCDKALELSVVLRSDKCIFEVVVPKPHTEFAVDDTEMDLVAIIGKMSSNTTRVEFTVFGGLEKTTLIPGDNQETLKLEKVQYVGGCG